MIKQTNILAQILLVSLTSFALSCSNGSDSSPTPPSVIPTKPVIETNDIGSIQKDDKLFKKFGAVDKFEWVPTGYQDGFVYDIYYYIPTSIKETKNSPALVFMHGGGESTMTRQGANDVITGYLKTVNGETKRISGYMDDMVEAAEKYKFIAVVPASNGLNWGGHTGRLMTELAKLMRANLNFDTNRLGLAGHSMGGMGITRSFTRVVNDYSFVNSVSAGMAPANQTENRLSKMFNIKYVQQVGVKDTFPEFITWSKSLEQNIKDMEWNHRKTSLFEMMWFNDGHVYGPAQTQKLESLFKGQRNIFQNELFGEIYFDNKTYEENKISYTYTGTKRYLWVENIPTTIADRFDFQVKAEKNSIDFIFAKDETNYTIYPKSKKFKVYLSEKMFDLSKDINIYDEGYFVAKYKAKAKPDRKPGMMDKDDSNTAYDDVFEFKFN